MKERILQEITGFVFVEDVPIQSDVILIPGSARAGISETAARLYREGYAPWVLPSGAYSPGLGRFAAENIDVPRYRGDHATDYAFCRHVLLENGVPERAILCEDRATNTMENAAYSAQVLREAGITVRRALLCCQAFHARRAALSYACHFPEIELRVIPTATQGICREDWWRTERGFRRVMGELEKCGSYFHETWRQFAAQTEAAAAERLQDG